MASFRRRDKRTVWLNKNPFTRSKVVVEHLALGTPDAPAYMQLVRLGDRDTWQIVVPPDNDYYEVNKNVVMRLIREGRVEAATERGCFVCKNPDRLVLAQLKGTQA